jgi:periplasmic protein TonB
MKIRNPLLLSVLFHGTIILGGGVLLTHGPEFDMSRPAAGSAVQAETIEVDLVIPPPPAPKVPEQVLAESPDVLEQESEMSVPLPAPTHPSPTPTSRPTPVRTKRPAPPAMTASPVTPSVQQQSDASTTEGSQAQSFTQPREESGRASDQSGNGTRNAEPDYLRNPPPVYPNDSRRAGEEGTVILKVRIDVSGAVEELSVRRSSGFSRLDSAAERAVRSWTFRPAYLAGIAVSSTVEVPVTFRLTAEKR